MFLWAVRGDLNFGDYLASTLHNEVKVNSKYNTANTGRYIIQILYIRN